MDTSRTLLRRPRRGQSNTSILDQSLIENDDEAEREQRRSMAQMRRSMARNEQNRTTTNSTVENAPMDINVTAARLSLSQKAVVLDDKELKNHFDLCRQLLATNKITMKNAWSLHIIDYINEIIQHKYHGNDLFQTAAVTMEICARVYECRVDDLYLDGVRLARALASAEYTNAEVLSDHEDDEAAAVGPKRKQKKKRKKFEFGNKRTICKNPKSLCGPITQITKFQFVVDADGDPEQTANLFAFVVPVDQNYNQHLNDSVNPGFLSFNIIDEVDTTVVGKYKPKVNNGFKICKDFQDFNMNKPDPLDDTVMVNLAERSIPVDNEVHVYHDNGQPIVDLDGSFHNPFDDINHDDIMDDEEEAQGFCNVRQVPITSFGPHLASLNEDTLASGTDRDASEWMKTVWIGPSHWKNKLVKPMATIFSGKVAPQKAHVKKKKKKDIDVPIDFTDRSRVDKINFQDKVKPRKLPKNKKTLTIPRNLLQYEDMEKLSLMDYVPDHIVTANPDGEEAFEHNPYDYNNLNDSQYCPDNAAGDGFDEPNPDHTKECHETNPAAERGDIPTAAMADIAEAGTSFDKSFHLPPPKPLYASKAKNVNMRKVREAMWKVISKGAIINEEKGTTTIRQTKFSTVYETVMAEQSMSLTKDLSIQIAFLVLLQITSEGNITLKSINNYSDTLILPFEEGK